MIDSDVGEAEGLGLGHATAGNLGYDISQFAAHLSNVFFAPQHLPANLSAPPYICQVPLAAGYLSPGSRVPWQPSARYLSPGSPENHLVISFRVILIVE